MGHTLTARKPDTQEVIATLRISGRRRRETKIYTALGAEQFNAQDSGTGMSAIFSTKKLGAVKNSIFLTADEREFLQTCFSYSKWKGIEIEFS